MTVQDIENAVAQLPPEELAAFRAWFEAFDAARGRLDQLADEALADHRRGRSREL